MSEILLKFSSFFFSLLVFSFLNRYFFLSFLLFTVIDLDQSVERLYVARTELTTLHAALVGSLEAHFLPSLECWEKKHIELLEEHKSELESSLEEVR